MTLTARVLVFDSDPDQRLRIVGKLGDRGYDNLIARSVDEALDLAKNNPLDIVIVSASVPDEERGRLNAALKELWATRHLPVIVVGGEGGTQPLDDRAAAIAEFLPREFHDLELFSHLSSLVRLKTMQTELERRLATTAEFGVRTPRPVRPPKSVKGGRALVVACHGPLKKRIDSALRGPLKVAHARDYAAGLAALGRAAVDLVFVGGSEDGKAALDFCTAMRGQSQHFTVPLVLIADARTFRDPVAPYVSGANDIVPTTLGIKDLRTRAVALVKQKRYREAMRTLYRQLGEDVTTDRLTGLYSHGFLHAHLARQIEDAHSWNKNLSVGYLDVDDLAAINLDYGYVAGDLLLREIGHLMANLVRGEDLVARVGNDEFCVIEPDTAPEVAEFALQRIAGVIGKTKFKLPGIEGPLAVSVTVGYTAIEPGDDSDSLIARAREQCEGNAKRAAPRPLRPLPPKAEVDDDD